MLHLGADDLLARPAVLPHALEPRVLTHLERVRVAPELVDEGVGVRRGHDPMLAADTSDLWPKVTGWLARHDRES